MNSTDKSAVLGELAKLISSRISNIYIIQYPGRVPSGHLLRDIASLLHVDDDEITALGNT